MSLVVIQTYKVKGIRFVCLLKTVGCDICTCPNGLLCIMVKAPAAAFTTVSPKWFMNIMIVLIFSPLFFADGPGDPSSTVPSPRAGKSKFACFSRFF